MGQKKFLVFLIIEAILCVALQLVLQPGPGGSGSLLTFPFEQIGDGLRALSLSGVAGNVSAVVLYILFSGSPLLALLMILRKRKLRWEDGLLAGLSVLMFFSMYLMVNPGMISDVLGGYVGASGGGRMLLSVVCYSVLAGYLVLRVLRQVYTADAGRLQRYFRAGLYLLGAIFVGTAFGIGFGELQSSFRTLVESNTVDGAGSAWGGAFAGSGLEGYSLGLSKVFLVIRYAVDILPYILDTVIVLTGLKLLDALSEDRYGEKAVALAQKISGQCGRMLAIAVVTNIGFNLVQLFFLGKLLVVDGAVQLPVLSIIFVMIVLFVTRLLTENKELKEDNDLFV